MVVNKTVIISEPTGSEQEVWKNGLLVAVTATIDDKGGNDIVYLLHENETVYEPVLDEQGNMTEETEAKVIKRAFAVTVPHPYSRKDIINAAEMVAYDLRDAMDVASFNAGLARKSREDAEDAEVQEHDEFIELIKSELDKFGIRS